jgi:hypothetical protein
MYVCQPSHTHARLVHSLVLVGIRFLVEAEAEENPRLCGGEEGVAVLCYGAHRYGLVGVGL